MIILAAILALAEPAFGPLPAGADPGACGFGAAAASYRDEALRPFLDHGFHLQPWEYEEADRIKNRYGVEAFAILAKHYFEITQGIVHQLPEVDNPYALQAWDALARQYAQLEDWQPRWAAQVHTQRELEAFEKVVSRRHTEKEEAEAATLDGPKPELLTPDRRCERSFKDLARKAVAGLPAACRMRLSGARISLRQWHEAGVADQVIARYQGPPLAPAADQACSAPRPGKLTLYWGPFYDFYSPGDVGELESALRRELGCRPVASRPRPAREADLRDALNSKPRKPRVCPVLKYTPPRIVGDEREAPDTPKDEMSRNVNEPSKPTRVVTPETAASPDGTGDAHRHILR